LGISIPPKSTPIIFCDYAIPAGSRTFQNKSWPVCLFVSLMFTGLPKHFLSIKNAVLKPQSQTACCLITGFLADVFDCYKWSFIMANILVQIAALLPLALFCLGEKKGFDLKNNIGSDEQLATYRHNSIWSS